MEKIYTDGFNEYELIYTETIRNTSFNIVEDGGYPYIFTKGSRKSSGFKEFTKKHSIKFEGSDNGDSGGGFYEMKSCDGKNAERYFRGLSRMLNRDKIIKELLF